MSAKKTNVVFSCFLIFYNYEGSRLNMGKSLLSNFYFKSLMFPFYVLKAVLFLKFFFVDSESFQSKSINIVERILYHFYEPGFWG